VTLGSRLHVPSRVLYQELDGEGVLLDLATETYYGLDEVGARFWSVLTTAATIDDGLSILAGEYDVAPDALYRDVSTLVASLAERGLVEIRRG
jgi:hypothetical protein